MADIKITDLRPAGSEFFADDENFMTDLTEDELGVWGGAIYDTVNINSDYFQSQTNTVGNSQSNNTSDRSPEIIDFFF